MKTHMDDDKELVSALADGQLHGEALDRSLQALAHDVRARQAWQAYHLIGDVLRSADLAGVTPQDRFMERLSQRLAAEPAPVREDAPSRPLPGAGRAEAANAPQARWPLVAGLGSLALVVAAVGWLALASFEPAGPAQASGPLLRDAQLDAMLAAHRQLGGVTGLQAPAGGLRHVTFEPPSR